MAFNLINPLYPQPAMVGNSFITSQVVTVTTGVTTVTAFAPSTSVGQIQLVSFDVQGDDVRVYWEGSTPSSSAGHILPGGSAYTWSANQFNNSKFILSGSGTAATIVASAFNGG